MAFSILVKNQENIQIIYEGLGNRKTMIILIIEAEKSKYPCKVMDDIALNQEI